MFFLLFLIGQIVLVADDATVMVDQQRTVLKREQHRLRAKAQRRQEAALLNRAHVRLSRDEVPTHSASISPSSVVQIHTITLVGASKLSRHQQYFLTKPYIGPMGISDIKQLLADIQNTYIRMGYTTTKPYPKPDQDLSSGALVIMVDEGRIAGIVDANGNKTLALSMAFPFLDGKVLNIRDIEQGLDQMNRLSSNQMKVKLIPQKKSLGYGTIVQVINHSDALSLYSASIQYDNHSDHSVRLYPRGIELSRDNALKLNDQWALSFSQANGVNGQNSNSASLGVSIPFGYSLLSYGYSQFEYHTLYKGLFRNFSMTGGTERHSFGLTQTVFRTQRSKTSVSVNLRHRDTHSFIEDVVNEPGTQVMTVADVGVSQTLLGWLGATWSFDVRAHRGLRFWGAPKDPSDLTPMEPRFQFEKTTAMGSVYTQIPIVGVPLLYKGVGRLQHGRQPLFSSEQMAIGGLYSVRGFSDPIMGGTGALVQQDISTPLHHLMVWAPLTNVVQPLGLHLIGGLDVGSVRPTGQSLWGTMVGAMVGIRHYGKSMTGEWAITKPLKASHWVKKNAAIVYWNVRIALI